MLPVSVGVGLVVELVLSALLVCTKMLNGFMKPEMEQSKYAATPAAAARCRRPIDLNAYLIICKVTMLHAVRLLQCVCHVVRRLVQG